MNNEFYLVCTKVNHKLLKLLRIKPIFTEGNTYNIVDVDLLLYNNTPLIKAINDDNKECYIRLKTKYYEFKLEDNYGY